MRKTFHDPDTVHPPLGHYSHAARLDLGDGSLIFVAGQGPIDAGGNLVGEGDMGRQAEQTFENVRAVLEANGAAMADVAKLTCYLTDMGLLGEMTEVRRRYFSSPAPASTAVEVSALAVPGMLVEVEAVAAT
jgi:reactive intermediate/imine deaminase